LWAQKSFVRAMSKKKTSKKPAKQARKIARKITKSKKKRVVVIPTVRANAQRGKLPRIKPSLRIDTSTDSQLKKWANVKRHRKPCTKGVGDVVDRVVKFAVTKNFSPCAL